MPTGTTSKNKSHYTYQQLSGGSSSSGPPSTSKAGAAKEFTPEMRDRQARGKQPDREGSCESSYADSDDGPILWRR